ncbi:S1/P1 nuclease [Hymenobacter sp. ISL-91]|uniref:S1/P1 nuclease n=1 Tax=Hymenobacter sp. ISL-91 TaxID=2819151 RepID=UPI001BEAA937|nr:S1/P1 nuclease [Hymenobacter sp. ISL-91]MBT2557652.1 S1/P1 nuclease [Hymenobacter sp. ISL-91]
MRKFLLPLLLLLLSPLHLWAWGADGHRAIALIAEHHLKRSARQQVQQLLGTENMALVSTWPDEIRYYPEGKETGPWHYVNSPSGLDHAQYLTELRTNVGPNAYTALQTQMAIMADKSKTTAQRRDALKYVIHIVGDIHQPLHTGHAEDKGGNDVKLKFRGRDTNLHGLWDSGLLDYQGLTYTEMAQQYNSGISRSDVRRMQAAEPAEWLWESYQASELLYPLTPNGTEVKYDYYPAHSMLMRQRIQEAGVRLAGVLNNMLG